MPLLGSTVLMRSKVDGGGATSASPPAPRAIDIQELLGGARELVIVHKGESYRLRITAKDRLILTK